MTAARLAGIARHDRPHGAMETLGSVIVSCAAGIAGDHRGALKPGRNKRQVTMIRAEDWQAATAETGVDIPWWERRANLLVEGMAAWPPMPGAVIRIGSGLAMRVTGECDPCARMDALAAGLCRALTPGWRGGVTMQVIADGAIAVGETVSEGV